MNPCLNAWSAGCPKKEMDWCINTQNLTEANKMFWPWWSKWKGICDYKQWVCIEVIDVKEMQSVLYGSRAYWTISFVEQSCPGTHKISKQPQLVTRQKWKFLLLELVPCQGTALGTPSESNIQSLNSTCTNPENGPIRFIPITCSISHYRNNYHPNSQM